MKNKRYYYIALALLLIVIALLGSQLAMAMWAKMIPAGAVSLIALLSLIFSRQSARDEREELHRLRAGNTAFLIGEVLVVGGFFIKGIVTGEVDQYLQWVAIAMFIVHLVTLELSKRRS